MLTTYCEQTEKEIGCSYSIDNSMIHTYKEYSVKIYNL